MSTLYKITGMGRGFDGLIVESSHVTVNGLHEITSIINDNVVFGDRNISFPVPAACLYINEDHLEPYDQKRKEFAGTAPLGVYLCDHRWRRNDLEVVAAEYERGMTVTVMEHEHQDGKYNDTRGRDIVHTRYTQNFLKRFESIKEQIEAEVKSGDLDDLIFYLKAVKEGEANG